MHIFNFYQKWKLQERIFARKLRKLLKNAPFQLLYFDQNTLYINSPHETTGEYFFLKIHKKYYEIIQYLILYLIFLKFVSIFLPQGGGGICQNANFVITFERFDYNFTCFFVSIQGVSDP